MPEASARRQHAVGQDRGVARVVRISDSADPRLADYAGLRDVELRRHVEAAEGLFLAEGVTVVRRAVAAGYEVRSLLLAERFVRPLADVLRAAGEAPCYVGPAEVVEEVTGFHVHRGVLASMRRRRLPTVSEVLAGARRVLVLEDLVDHTNVGAAFRSGAALGIDAVVLSPRCADPLYRRSVRVSMGAVLTLPYARMTGWYDGLAALRASGFRILALTPAADATDLADVRLDGGVALVVGSEGDGLSPHWLGEADQRVRIPMAPGVDSLNVAAATAVACYVLSRAGR
jgi:tRNA G18 (ribose-2'-O)-methylase SpoU